jgi:hypothetical protein
MDVPVVERIKELSAGIRATAMERTRILFGRVILEGTEKLCPTAAPLQLLLFRHVEERMFWTIRGRSHVLFRGERKPAVILRLATIWGDLSGTVMVPKSWAREGFPGQVRASRL